jgi:Family of unknown function (DUF6289)
MKLTKTLRMFGIISALLWSAATQSSALPTNELEIYYYSDANYENEVGYLFRGCEGGVYREGRQTQYAVSSLTPCDSNPPLAEFDCYIGGRLTKCPANLCDSSLFECW